MTSPTGYRIERDRKYRQARPSCLGLVSPTLPKAVCTARNSEHTLSLLFLLHAINHNANPARSRGPIEIAHPNAIRSWALINVLSQCLRGEQLPAVPALLVDRPSFRICISRHGAAPLVESGGYRETSPWPTSTPRAGAAAPASDAWTTVRASTSAPCRSTAVTAPT